MNPNQQPQQQGIVSPIQPQQTGPQVPQGLDPKAYVLTKAIAYQENGGNTPNYTAQGASGEGGAYQFEPKTWQNYAQQILGDSKAAMTPENQNQVAYGMVSKWLQQGYSPAQVASMWNAGEGAPDAYMGNAGTNAEGVNYDTAKYAKGVQNYAEQLWNGQTPTPYQAPSVGGFAKNVVSSGANFAGNILNAVVHPIETAQGLGNVAVGGLDTLGGQQNAQTGDWSNFANYFVNRYGGVSNLENTLYTDPVGALADLSAALGVGAGVADAGELGARAVTSASAADTADAALQTGVRTMAGDQAIGNSVTRGLGAAGDALSSAAGMVNPLSPIIAGAGKLASAANGTFNEGLAQVLGQSSDTVKFYRENPELTSADDFLQSESRLGIAQDIESTLGTKIAEKSETGAGYAAYHETPTPVEVAPDFLDNAFRTAAKVDVTDGVITPTSGSVVRSASDIRELQGIYNTFKGDFLNNTMDSDKFLNLRQDLDETADFRKGLTKKLQFVARDIRTQLNDTYRSQIPALAEKDADYEAQSSELDRLRKGFIDKEGNLTPSAVNKIANAGGKGKDLDLARLEELMPGITKRLQALKTIEAINNSGIQVGAYTRSIMQAGRLGATLFGAATGNIKLLAGALVMDFIARPDTAVAIMKAVAKVRPEVVAPVMGALAKYATTGAVASAALNANPTNISQQTPQNTQAPQESAQTPTQQPLQTTPSNQSSLPDTITQHPNYQAAVAAGLSPQEITAYLSQ